MWRSMSKLYKFKKKSESEKFMNKVDSNKIADFLTLHHPDVPYKVINALALAMIYSQYLALVCKEEGYLAEEILSSDKEIDNLLDLYAKKTIH